MYLYSKNILTTQRFEISVYGLYLDIHEGGLYFPGHGMEQ